MRPQALRRGVRGRKEGEAVRTREELRRDLYEDIRDTLLGALTVAIFFAVAALEGAWA